MILKLRSRASISNVLWGFYENLGRDVYSVYQSFSPNLPTACTTTLLLFKCSFFFVGELEIHLRQTAHYQRVFFKIKLTYYLIAPKTTKKNKMAIKLRA